MATDSTSGDIVVGPTRARILREFGLAPGLLSALRDPAADPLTPWVIAGDGEVLAEIADETGVAGALPPGPIVPVCHVEESQLWYVLLLQDDGRWHLVHWTPESTEAIEGGLVGWLTDMVVELWEEREPSDDALVAWAARMGHPAPERVVRERAAAESTMGTREGHRHWRRTFLASLGSSEDSDRGTR